MEVSPVEYAVLDTRACATCGYDLRGQVEPRCPECGTAFDPGELPVPDIPWVKRAKADPFGAYWAMVAWVLRNPRAAARTIAASRVFLDTDSRRFRRAVIWQAVGSTALLVSVVVLRAMGDASGPSVAAALLYTALSVPGAALFFWGASYAHLLPRGWWTRPILADHAYALHNFAMAPVALLPVAVLVEAVALVLDLGQRARAAQQAHEAALLACAAIAFAWWACTMLMTHASRLWGARELGASALLLLVRGMILAMFVVLMTFLLVGFFAVVVELLSRG